MGGGVSAGRLVFANQLRGFAALVVVVGHLFGTYWGSRAEIAAYTFAPVQTGPAPELFPYLGGPWFNAGPFGVAVFFLISGLVIPISLDHHTRGGFLLARALRIYPTYAAALLIELLALRAGGLYWHRPVALGWGTILANLSLVHTALGIPTIDGVNWTLAIEVKFYLLMALAAPALRRGRLRSLLGVALAVAALAALADNFPRHPFGRGAVWAGLRLGAELQFLPFMLIGTAFNLHGRGLLRTRALLGATVALFALFAQCWRLGVLAEQVPFVTVNYLWGLLLFAALYALRRRARPVRVLDALAAVSYPLYLVHPLVGFSAIAFLTMGRGWDPTPAALAALALALVLAVLLHRTVERHSIALGRRLARRVPAPPQGAAVNRPA